MKQTDGYNRLSGDTMSQAAVKDSALYLGMFLFLAVITALLVYLTSQGFGYGWYINAIQIFVFLALGTLNIIYLKSGISKRGPAIGAMRWQLSLLTALLIAVTLVLISVFTSVYNWFLIAASAAAFLLPATIAEAWQTYRLVPGVTGIPWQGPSLQEVQAMPVYKKDLQLKFRVLPAETGKFPADTMVLNKKSSQEIPAQVSRYSKIGLAFSEFKAMGTDASTASVTGGEPRTSVMWTFYVSDFVLGKRWLDAERSFQQNGILNNSIIIAQRIKETDL